MQRLGSSGEIGPRHLTPGTIVADRYQIVGLVGRGRMGDVYRADDLRLDQQVALKFLPEAVAADPARLVQFHNEVRVARQIAHKNVCRVYDIGEADGRPFLSMEYVDGEDLASLLRRIGRLPQDKGLEIARQICDGLAAAHERSVLHRDLKPANVMLDGEGKVRIADFGLASAAGEVKDIRSGTPAYMAPEQLTGREVSVRSDIYALGLLLYEIFTGRRVFDAQDVAGLLRLHAQGAPLPTSAVGDLDPAIERAILRCLDSDPRQRPASALAVSAALPGGDPLAAALAAGETPSPEMVAAAGETWTLPRSVALGHLVWTLAGILAFMAVTGPTQLVNRIPFHLPLAVLVDRAQTIVQELGYTAAPADTAIGLTSDWDYLMYRSRTKAEGGVVPPLDGRPAAVTLWYRTSPRPLVPLSLLGRADIADPPVINSGMTLVQVDTLGRLVEFHAVPPQREEVTGTDGSMDWALLFELSDVPRERFAETPPEWTPRVFAHERAAWEGTLAELPDLPVRIEAAAYDGRPVYFQIIAPWTRAARMEPPPRPPFAPIIQGLMVLIFLGLLVAAAMTARKNLRSGRGDRAGAARLAVFVFAVGAAELVLGHLQVAGLDAPLQQLDRFLIGCAAVLFRASLLWLLYLALEPSVRRFWPDGLIGWSRLLTGRLRDPLVARDVLFGVSAGTALALLISAHRWIPMWMGHPEPTVYTGMIVGLLGLRFTLAVWLGGVYAGLLNALVLVLTFALLQMLLRRTLPALIGVGAVFAVLTGGELETEAFLWPTLFMMLLYVALVVTTMWRFGLLTLTVAFTSMFALNRIPLSLDLSRWDAQFWMTSATGVLLLGLWGFYMSRGGGTNPRLAP